MKNTLHYFCKALDWKGGTIHQAKKRFAIASMDEMNKICRVLLDNMSDIEDIEMVQYFTGKRLEAVGFTSLGGLTSADSLTERK